MIKELVRLVPAALKGATLLAVAITAVAMAVGAAAVLTLVLVMTVELTTDLLLMMAGR